MGDWMIYGATGYTGTLVAEEAVRRGHKPLLAGRSAAKLRPLAERLGLEYAAVALDDADVCAIVEEFFSMNGCAFDIFEIFVDESGF